MGTSTKYFRVVRMRNRFMAARGGSWTKRSIVRVVYMWSLNFPGSSTLHRKIRNAPVQVQVSYNRYRSECMDHNWERSLPVMPVSDTGKVSLSFSFFFFFKLHGL